MHTPFFQAWRHRLAPLGSRTASTARHVRAYTLCHLESCFRRCVPAHLFPKASTKCNSRDRHYTRLRTFWCMMWQALNPEASGREVVRQLQALFGLDGGPKISPDDGAYCRAKHRLPQSEFPKLLTATAQAADEQVSASAQLQGRPLKVADGSALTLWDSYQNREAYPPPQSGGLSGFPMMRIVVLFSLLSGATLALAQGSLLQSELSLFTLLTSYLAPRDILIADRGFGYYAFIAWLGHIVHVDFIGRTRRHIDGRRRLRRLGHNDWLVRWQKPAKASPWLSAVLWAAVPQELIVRVVQGSCSQKGFRVRQVTVVTTLLDPKLYPATEILQAYLRRWRLEMCLDDLKTSLRMDMLRSRTPEGVYKEVFTRLAAHNLIRYTMAQAATHWNLPLVRISFKGSVDALRQFTHAMACARSQKKRQELWTELLETLAADLVPERPGRREPRAVKRKKNRYPRLRGPRRRFRDCLKRNKRRTLSRLRKLGLK
jgi:hypothetical protein